MEDCCKEKTEEKQLRKKPKDKGKTLQYIMLALVAVLLIVSITQAVQISNIATGKAVTQSTSLAAPSAASAPAQSAPASAPTMVGGC